MSLKELSWLRSISTPKESNGSRVVAVGGHSGSGYRLSTNTVFIHNSKFFI